jgi:hypothetical protein
MFFLIWRGWGILVPVFLVLGFVIGVGFSSVVPGPHSPCTLPVSFAVTGLVAAAGIWFTTRAIEARPGRVLIDKATGREFKVGANAGSLFFIPTRYWAFIAPGLALILAATAAFDPAALKTSPSSAPARSSSVPGHAG